MSSKTQNESLKKTDFGVRLKEAFENISNQAIADKIGVGKSTLTAYMQGRIPPPNKLLEIEKETQCNLTWLLTGKGSPKAQIIIQRPQGIILQGTKGGIGTSTSAVLIAANLALRGYGVLVAADELHTCSHLLLANKIVKSDERDRSINELYITTRHKNLDFFIPSNWKYDYPIKITKKFDFDYKEINERYQYVIFDVQKSEDPFNYPNYSFTKTSVIEPILKNASVLMPYQPQDSFIDNVNWNLKKIEQQKRIYPEADFLGAFIINRWRPLKREKKNFTEAVNELEEFIGAKLFKTVIDHQKDLTHTSYKEIESKLFSRKTGFFKNYSVLVDEILQKLSR